MTKRSVLSSRFRMLAAACGVLLTSAPAMAQPKGPPAKGPDMEIDPDAPPAPPPPPPEKKEEAPLPPPEAGAWGVGGKDEEGKFAPQKKKTAEEAEDNGPIDYGPKGAAGVDAVIGFGQVIVPTEGAPNGTKVTPLSFVVGAFYRFGDIWGVGLRVPFTNASVTPPPSDTLPASSTFALGNIAIDLRPTFAVSSRLKIPVGLSFYVPLAAGDYFADATQRGSRSQAIVNQAAAASRGWEENALFASGRAAFAPSIGLTYDFGGPAKPAHFAARTKLEVMVQTGGNDAAVGYQLSGVTTDWVTGASFFYDFLDGKLAPGLRAWLAVASLPTSNPSGNIPSYGGAQVVIEPDITTAIPISGSTKIAAGVGYVLPLGGELGGKDGASIGGLRLKAGLIF